MIAKILNTYTYTATVPASLASTGPAPSHDDISALASEVDSAALSNNKMKRMRTSVKRLVVSIFREANLMKRIVEAQRINDYEVEQPKGLRLGYMGHLSYISDEICKVFERCAPELDSELHDCIVSEEWQEYLSHALKETRDRDRQVLGGARPDAPVNQQPMANYGDDAPISAKSTAQPKQASSSQVDDDESNMPMGGDNDAYTDQFARYLCQQLVKDIPDRFMGAESPDDEVTPGNQWVRYRR